MSSFRSSSLATTVSHSFMSVTRPIGRVRVGEIVGKTDDEKELVFMVGVRCSKEVSLTCGCTTKSFPVLE